MKEAIKKYNEYLNYRIPEMKSLPDNYVFDENKSVKWNREQVNIYNEECKRRKEEGFAERNNLYAEAEDGLFNAMQEEATYNMTKEEAKAIWEWLQYCGDLYNLESSLLDLIKLAEKLYFARAASLKKQAEEKAVSEK